MIIHNFDQRSDEWYSIRLGRLTGSDFHTFLGNSETKKNKLLQKAAEKITGKSDEERIISEDIQRGVDLEDEAILTYEMTTGNIVDKVGFIESNEYVGCSPDGLVGNDGIIEVKCPKQSIFLKQVVEEKIKPEYYTQIQFNLLISGRKWCDYIAYNKNFPLFIKRFEIDEEVRDKIIKALEECTNKIKEIVESYKQKGLSS